MIKEDIMTKSAASDFIDSDESNSVSDADSQLEVPDFLLSKLKEMHEYLCKLENPANRQSFVNFMIKAVAVESLDNVD